MKSRTWSKQDAEKKAHLAEDLLKVLGASPEGCDSKDYIEMAEAVIKILLSKPEGFLQDEIHSIRTLESSFLQLQKQNRFIKVGGLGDVAGSLPDALTDYFQNTPNLPTLDIRLFIPIS